KQKEGDSRTPEGLYYINGRNPNSRFFRSLRISFPNEIDKLIAKSKGDSPGGDIVIHGEPNDPIKRRNLKKDWTQGCIALSDEDMYLVWRLVEEGIPILIKP
ncbi:MAG: L,D-transpeptidase family protein, partial [Gammaproteobacteria bacterium]|nr:L,D-transpeptidase family protein [Gammaproteobacteria bacterium]